MAKQTAMMEDGEMAPKLPKPNYKADPNAQARMRAGRRSSNFNAGKDLEDGVKEDMIPDGFADGGEVPGEGGVVAEAHKELAAVQEEKAEEQAEGEVPTGEGESPVAEEGEMEMPKEESMEPEVPAIEGETPEPESEAEEPAIEKFAEEEMQEPEHQESGAIEQFAQEEMQEPQHSAEYMAPEGASHDELIDQYHEALAMGDVENAGALYKQLQNHRFHENRHRAKSLEQAEKEAKAYTDAVDALVAKHPQLGEDGLESDKVLALVDVYRNNGMPAVQALHKAVADLYPEAPMAPKAEEMAPPAVKEEEIPPVAEVKEEEPAPAPEAEAEKEEGPLVPDMSERLEAKKKIVTLPSASARKEEAPPPKPATRSDAIALYKKSRGQA